MTSLTDVVGKLSTLILPAAIVLIIPAVVHNVRAGRTTTPPVINQQVDLGPIRQEQTLTFDAAVTNSTNRAVTVVDVKTDCGCTVITTDAVGQTIKTIDLSNSKHPPHAGRLTHTHIR